MPNTAARDREAQMLTRCAAIALERGARSLPIDSREANVFRVASMVIQSRFPAESRRLMDAAEHYYLQHPSARAPVVDVIRYGDVISLPRLRDSLTRLMRSIPGVMDLSCPSR